MLGWKTAILKVWLIFTSNIQTWNNISSYKLYYENAEYEFFTIDTVERPGLNYRYSILLFKNQLVVCLLLAKPS